METCSQAALNSSYTSLQKTVGQHARSSRASLTRVPDCSCLHRLHTSPGFTRQQPRSFSVGTDRCFASRILLPVKNVRHRKDVAITRAESRTHAIVQTDKDQLPAKSQKSRSQAIMERIAGRTAESGGAGGAVSYEALVRADEQWLKLRTMKEGREAGPTPEFVKVRSGRCEENKDQRLDFFDVVVCGGTLGVFVAAALAAKGKRVAIIERGELRGRAQEWNISGKELSSLVEQGVLNEDDLKAALSVVFNPMRCGFHKGTEVFVNDILNIGVLPDKLIQAAKQTFVARGGTLLERTGLQSLEVFEDRVLLSLGKDRKPIAARLVLDAMGNASPIVRQIRWGKKPDGVCLVVGSCGRGFEDNVGGDIIYTDGPLSQIGESPMQYFWEAFPAGSGPTDRTTYMFTYIDAKAERPSLEALLEDYWDLMPQYQKVKLDDLEILRVLFGFFPTYRKSPLPAAFDRVLQIGDASGIQSPLSFGGFGSITRHLKRLTDGICDALEADLLAKDSLSLINPYQPNLSGAWLLQRSMSAEIGTDPPKAFINDLLSTNFAAMQKLGDSVLRPFLQDVTQFGPLALTMGSMMLNKPQLLPRIIKQTGVVPILDWGVHFVGLGAYTFLHKVVTPALRKWTESQPMEERFKWRRIFEAWEFGSGLDYH